MTTPRDVDRRGVEELPDEIDVVIVGAGLSGIGMAYRLAERRPELSYLILEARHDLGGTWDLFRYPGVRSDSDMHTLSFPFRPWGGTTAIADGADILQYLRTTAAQSGIDAHIHYDCRVDAADWSTPDQRWTLHVTGASPQEPTRRLRARHVHLAAGYYRYDTGYRPELPGVEDFAGQVVDPQFWPPDLDHSQTRVVVIGSGATAITLVPALAERAEHVTMLQRTPTYLFSMPQRDLVADGLRRVLPAGAAHRAVRAKNVGLQTALFQLSRRRPGVANRLILGAVRRRLGAEAVAEHFTPPYDVWDQRLCAMPDGDFLDAYEQGDCSVVTGRIDRLVPEGIRLTDGRVLPADLVVTATGLVLQTVGGVALRVDGTRVAVERSFAYRGIMLSGVPNATMTVGYTNASWTLRADLVSRYVTALLSHMDRHGYGVAVPVAPEGMVPAPILDFGAGYVRRAVAAFPKVGDRAPWTMPQSYPRDLLALGRADVTRDMTFIPRDRPQALLPRGAQVGDDAAVAVGGTVPTST